MGDNGDGYWRRQGVGFIRSHLQGSRASQAELLGIGARLDHRRMQYVIPFTIAYLRKCGLHPYTIAYAH